MGFGSHCCFSLWKVTLKTQRSWTMVKSTSTSWLSRPTTAGRKEQQKTFWWRSASSPPAPLGGKVSLPLCAALAPAPKVCPPWRPNRSVPPLPSTPPSPWAHAGWNNRVEYEPGTGALTLFPNVHLETCDESVASAQVVVELETSHIGKGCDRDTYSEKSLHRLCGKKAREEPQAPKAHSEECVRVLP